MDAKRYRMRPFEEADYEPLGRLQSERFPELPSTAREEREWDQLLERAHLLNEKWTVEDRSTGKVAAVAALSHALYAYHPHKFWVAILVDGGHAHQGIGRALATLLHAEALEHRAVCYWTNVRKDDAPSLHFAAQQGFVELRTTWLSVLDLSGPERPPTAEEQGDRFEAEGIRFATLAQEGPQRPEVRHRIHDLWTETSRDVPRMGEFVPLSFAQFEVELDRSGVIPEAFFLAAHGDTYIGSSHLERDLAEPDSLMVGFTGTRSEFRGRGIATTLKQRTLEYARSHGIRYLKTFNDSLNDPIWKINEKLGFRRTVQISNLQRDFAPGRPEGGRSPTP
jgi:RimJ/RimL family protein N-acetyltransferase